MTRFGALAERIDERLPGINLPLMSVSQIHGVVRRSTLTDSPQRADSLDAYKVCRSGDVVFNKMSIRAGAMGLAAEDGLVTYHYEVMRPRPGSDPRFIVYVMKSEWFTAELIKRERGIGAGDASASVRTTEVPYKVLRTIDCYVPKLDDQRAIADYLDRETQKIDELITEQRGLIETLRERRIAIIRALVSGVEQGGSTDPSDEWFGLLPENWQIAPVLYDFDVTLGKMLNTSKNKIEGSVEAPYVAAGSIQPDSLKLDPEKTMSFTLDELDKYSLCRGDIVVVEGGAGYGRCHYLTNELPGWGFQNHVARVRPTTGRSTGRFLTYCLKACLSSGYIEANNRTSTMPSLSRDVLRAIRIPRPPINLQESIADKLDEQTSRIDDLISESEDLIALSQERRAALITAAVTGQIDVRTAA